MCQKKHFLDTIGRYEKIHIYDDFFSIVCKNILLPEPQTGPKVRFTIGPNLGPDFGQVRKSSGSNFGSGPNRGITIATLAYHIRTKRRKKANSVLFCS